jgi:hypothetical protein
MLPVESFSSPPVGFQNARLASLVSVRRETAYFYFVTVRGFGDRPLSIGCLVHSPRSKLSNPTAAAQNTTFSRSFAAPSFHSMVIAPQNAIILTRLFSLALCCLASWIVASHEEFAQHMNVAAQDAQADITLITSLAPVAATLLAIANLQSTYRRFHPRMMLTGLAKLHGCFFLLTASASLTLLGNTRMRHDLSQLLLVVRSMKTSVE